MYLLFIIFTTQSYVMYFEFPYSYIHASSATLGVCTHTLWVAHQSNASLKMLNRNTNAIANANVEYLKGKRKTRTKMLAKVVFW